MASEIVLISENPDFPMLYVMDYDAFVPGGASGFEIERITPTKADQVFNQIGHEIMNSDVNTILGNFESAIPKLFLLFNHMAGSRFGHYRKMLTEPHIILISICWKRQLPGNPKKFQAKVLSVVKNAISRPLLACEKYADGYVSSLSSEFMSATIKVRHNTNLSLYFSASAEFDAAGFKEDLWESIRFFVESRENLVSYFYDPPIRPSDIKTMCHEMIKRNVWISPTTQAVLCNLVDDAQVFDVGTTPNPFSVTNKQGVIDYCNGEDMLPYRTILISDASGLSVLVWEQSDTARALILNRNYGINFFVHLNSETVVTHASTNNTFDLGPAASPMPNLPPFFNLIRLVQNLSLLTIKPAATPAAAPGAPMSGPVLPSGTTTTRIYTNPAAPGTASPKLSTRKQRGHLRRGHWREYKNGPYWDDTSKTWVPILRVWVDPYYAGDPSNPVTRTKYDVK